MTREHAAAAAAASVLAFGSTNLRLHHSCTGLVNVSTCQWQQSSLGPGRREKSVCRVHLTFVAELRAGLPRRPYRGAPAAATDEVSEGAKCGRRAAVQLTFSAPTNGPRASSSAKLGGSLLWTGDAEMWPRKKTRRTRERAAAPSRRLTVASREHEPPSTPISRQIRAFIPEHG